MTFPKVPNLSQKRENKDSYTSIPYDEEHWHRNDELVNPNIVGVKAQTFYAAKMTAEDLRKNPKMSTPLLRKNVVNRLICANNYLRKSPDVKTALGFNCELEARDCLRTLAMQEYVYNVYWPEKLREQGLNLTGDALKEELKKCCAMPNMNGPHISGGAVDIALINLETGAYVNRGESAGDAKFPDYYENYDGKLHESQIDQAVVMMRRVLYYAMTEIAGLQVNPTEIWHYGRGDKLWAYMNGSKYAFYQGVA